MNESCCRICLTSVVGELIPLFSLQDGSNLADKVKFCSGIEIQQDDFLPQQICSECSDNIKSACEIKTKCIESDRFLRNGFKLETGLEAKRLKDLQKLLVVTASESKERLKIKKPPLAKTPKINTSSSRENFNEMNLNNQASTKSSSEDRTCVFCDKTFKTIVDKKRHMKADHLTEDVCTICNKKRASVFAAEKCIRDHRYGFPFLCQMCAKGFRSKYDLKEHEDKMHSDNLLFCDKCGFKTKYKTNIVSHITRIHLSIANKKFPCPHESCPGLFYSKRNALNIHLYRYHGVAPPITCNVCNFGFTTESELRCHRTRCSGAPSVKKSDRNQRSLKPFYDEGSDGRLNCKLCSKSYESKQSFAVHHIMKHRDNKTCGVCNKTFSTACSYYNHHKVVHLKIKKYHCEHVGCGKSFGSKFILNNHKNTHTGEKPFACNFCSFRSGDLPTVTKHRKKMHAHESRPT